ncbi:MAG: polysaccharide biosynthesis/export family protein [Bacteroidales bacterium]|nr:polysaccharide biosynthesis/export family protein [Bacteroidales bacterium]
MTKSFVKFYILAAAVALVAACGTPKNIAYLQDVSNEMDITTAPTTPIRLQPMDQISVVVNGLDPQVSAMFNLPYFSRRMGESMSLTSGGNVGSMTSSQMISGYTVDSEGFIDFPVLGKINLLGKTRAETSEYIKQLLVESKQIKDPVVTVEFMNLGFSVLGEVARPGRYRIDRDEFTLFDAISLAGDMTINAQRENLMVIRDSGTDHEKVYTIDLTQSSTIYTSPAYYIQQGDLIYITPNKKRMRESTVMGNSPLTPSFWLSLVSSITSITTSVLLILSR